MSKPSALPWLAAAAGAVLAVLAVLAAPPPAAADPCCVSPGLTCSDLPAASCTPPSIYGYCDVGLACSQPTCNPSAILPIRLLRAVKAGADVALSWDPETNADRYDVWYTPFKVEIPNGSSGGTAAGVTPQRIATVPRNRDAGAVPGPGGTVRHYQVDGQCPAAPAQGACCSGSPPTACALTSPTACAGTFLGTGTTCSPSNPCVAGACCTATGCSVTLAPDCAAGGGTYLGDNTTCSAGACVAGACCSGNTCADQLPSQCTPPSVFVGGACAADTCVPGACCTSGGCSQAIPSACAAGGGTFLGGACGAQLCARGACCDGTTCTPDVLAAQCGGAMVYLGDNSTCASPPAPCETGACCSGSNCNVTQHGLCVGAGQAYVGDGVACAGNTCSRGACCASDFSCTETTAANCTGTSVFGGLGTSCSPSGMCGACCDTGGQCAGGRTVDACTGSGGTYRGDRTACGPSTCPQPGACCTSTGCVDGLTQQACLQPPYNGGFQGVGSMCSGGTCTGRCCDTTGACSETTGFLCHQSGRAFGGNGTTCATPCDLGACCSAIGCLPDVTQADCAAGGGNFVGIGTTCASNPCTGTGACCRRPFGCIANSTVAGCAQIGGTFMPGQICASVNNVCFPGEVVGACCSANGCSIRLPADCAPPLNTYLGDGTSCVPDPCQSEPVGACCCVPPVPEPCIPNQTQRSCARAIFCTWAGPNSSCNDC